MDKSERELVSDARRVLENPYAHIERIEVSQPGHGFAANLPAGSVAASRRLLENPYAYLDGAGEYSGQGSTKRPANSNRWSNDQIEEQVHILHSRLWRERDRLWDSRLPTDPIDILDPEVAIRMIGFDFQMEEGLGQMPGRGGPIEVAGLIDTQARLIRVGRQFPAVVRSFTAAHELAHAVLHPSMGALHRDKPLDGSPMLVDRVEVEANKFATLFLMPAKLIRARFAQLFQCDQFELSEATAFALSGQSMPDLQRALRTRRDLSRALAGAERFNGRHFVPLSSQFRVSREAMAIRLEELALVPEQA